MAHSKLARSTMFDWIEQCLDAGTALPTDAQIVDRYCFTSTEQARTLLAELADAGKITIRGYGDHRVITLGRTKSVAAGSNAPIAPTIKRTDPVIETGMARIAAIVARTKKAASATVAVKPEPVEREEPAAMPQREEPMPVEPSRKIEFTGEALQLIEDRAAAADLPFKAAAAELVLAAAYAARQVPEPGMSRAAARDTPATIDDLCDQLRDLFVTRDQAAIDDVEGRRAAAEARADAAEAKLAQARALFA